jgi:hypothetical protein
MEVFNSQRITRNRLLLEEQAISHKLLIIKHFHSTTRRDLLTYEKTTPCPQATMGP